MENKGAMTYAFMKFITEGLGAKLIDAEMGKEITPEEIMHKSKKKKKDDSKRNR